MCNAYTKNSTKHIATLLTGHIGYIEFPITNEKPKYYHVNKNSSSQKPLKLSVFSQSQTMCIQVVTQVFAKFRAELWKDNHHTNFQLIK